MFTLTQAARNELVEFLKSVGVTDVSERAVESFADDIDDNGHLEISGRYTASGSPATIQL